jgi:hypothetical protein
MTGLPRLFDYGKVALYLPVIVHIKESVHHTVAKSIEEIPMV